jgi:hypothetical protein
MLSITDRLIRRRLAVEITHLTDSINWNINLLLELFFGVFQYKTTQSEFWSGNYLKLTDTARCPRLLSFWNAVYGLSFLMFLS